MTEPGDDATAEHAVELGDARRLGLGEEGVDVVEQLELGDRPRPKRPVRRPGPTTSSTRVFHAPHPVHCPDHFGWPVPQSAQACTVFVLLPFMRAS